MLVHDPGDDKSTLFPAEFWVILDELVRSSEMVIDRPKLSVHPRYPDLIYPLDYGYLDGTRAMDGGGIDVWVGSLPASELVGLAITVDLLKRDIEIKLLLGCTQVEIQLVMAFLNGYNMRAWFVNRFD